MGRYADFPGLFPSMYRQNEHGVWVSIDAKKKSKKLCQVFRCMNPNEKSSKTNSGRSLKCSRCRMRLWRANNSAKAIFSACKFKAQRRGIPWEIDFEEFMGVVTGTGYLELRGRKAAQLHLDRIDSTKGYVSGNLRVITAAENTSKSHYEPGYGQGPESDPWDESDPF